MKKDKGTHVLHEMEHLLNHSFCQNANAQEYNLAYVNGYFQGISEAVRSLGYRYYYDSDLHRLIVKKDAYASRPFSEYEMYTARIADDHFRTMMKYPQDDEDSNRIHEHSIIEGMNEVLMVFGKELEWKPDKRQFQVVDYGKRKLS